MVTQSKTYNLGSRLRLLFYKQLSQRNSLLPPEGSWSHPLCLLCYHAFTSSSLPLLLAIWSSSSSGTCSGTHRVLYWPDLNPCNIRKFHILFLLLLG